jgi:adenosylmethionine-8-amino-7-oxononanoate aminotransferase
MAAAAAGAVLQAIQQRGLVDRVQSMGATLNHALRDRFGQHPHVGDIRGRGLFRGLEIVQDRSTKAPFDPSLKINARIKKAAMAAGLICYPAGGTVDGQSGDHVLLAPPFIIEDWQIEELVEKLDQSIGAVLSA